jgi:type IV secretory pathway VirB10-like protein
VPDVEVTKETREFSFKVAAEAASPPGQHKSLFCQVTLTLEGEAVAFASGSTELRIDPPPPPKPAVAGAPPPPPPPEKKEAPPPEKPKKPLTRLEKLRLEAEERAAASRKESQK